MARYRLTESRLRGLIREAVKSVLNEIEYMSDGDLEPQYNKFPDYQWDYGTGLNPAVVAGLDPHTMRRAGMGNKENDNLASWDYFDAVHNGADAYMRDRAEREYADRTSNLRNVGREAQLYAATDDPDSDRALLKQHLDNLSRHNDERTKYERQADSRPLHRKGSLNRELS